MCLASRTVTVTFALFLALPAVAQPPPPWFVKPTAQGLGNGSSWANACTLQYALDNADAGHDIWVAQGTYYPSVIYPSGTDNRRKTFHISTGIMVYGGFAGTETELPQRNPEANETILDGDINADDDPDKDCYHVVYFDLGRYETTKLSGFTIRNGRADSTTDAIDRVGAGILLTTYDEAGYGPSLNRLVVRDNYATGGGAGACMDGDFETYLTNCRFESNNAPTGNGGAVLLQTIAGTTNNATFQNCVFFDNECPSGHGGGIAVVSGHKLYVKIVNCSFFGNSAATSGDGGGGLYVELTAIDYVGVNVINSILWGNSADQIYDNSGSVARVSVMYSDVADGDWCGGFYENICDDPEFSDPLDGDLRLRLCSPAINTGDNFSIDIDRTDVNDADGTTEQTPWDIRKLPRILAPGSVVDMGAYEDPQCPGDLDADRDVDISDLAIMLSCFGQNCFDTTSCCLADLDCDDDNIDISDMTLLLSRFGTSCNDGLTGLDRRDGGGGATDTLDLGSEEMTFWILSAGPDELLLWHAAGMPRW